MPAQTAAAKRRINPAKLVTPGKRRSEANSLSQTARRVNMPDILHKIGIQKSSPNGVYHALTTVEGLSGWWTQASGEPAKAGGEITLSFGKSAMKMTVAEALH